MSGADIVVARLILAHADPRQVARLVASWPGDAPVAIHFDARAPDALFAELRARLADRRHVLFAPRRACRWGGMGIVAGTLAAIATLTAAGRRFTHAVLLSGADYPIKPPAALAAHLAAAGAAEFIEAQPLDRPNRWSDHGGLYRAPDRVLRRHLRVRSRVWGLPWRRRLPGGMRPFGGSQWWCLSAAALAHVERAADARLRRFFRASFIPDESFFQTILGNSPFAAHLRGDPLHLAIWDRPEPPYPATLTAADLPLLRAAPQFFARKFNPRVDAAVLDALDAELGAAAQLAPAPKPSRSS